MRNLILICTVVLFANVALAQEVIAAVPAIDPIFIPPTWLQEMMLLIKGLPIVGPYVVEAMKWVGVATVIITSLTGAVLTVLKALHGALKLAKLEALAMKVEAFQNSKIVFWLKYFSNFNAQKAVK